MNAIKDQYDRIAEKIYGQLTQEFRYTVHKGQTIAEQHENLAYKLSQLPDHEVKLWSSVVDELCRQDYQTAPLPKEIIKSIKAKAREITPSMNVNPRAIFKQEKDYARIWEASDDQQKKNFFIDHAFNVVPSFVKYWFRKYHKEHRGWTNHEASMMINYWAMPYKGADHGAMSAKQNEVIEYFRDRVDG